MTKVNTYLNFNGNTEDAFNFYKSVFGGDFSSLVRFGDMPAMEGAPIPDADLNKLMHVALPIGEDFTLMGTDSLESLGQQLVQGNNVYLSVHPDSMEEADRIFNALSEGAEVEMPMADQTWGDYFGSLKDKFGTGWMVNYGRPQEG
ncbi:VOC family protein [soil metagenome]